MKLMLARISKPTDPFLIKTALIYNFSTFKTKFQKLQTTNYENLSQFYDDLSDFEKSLQYVQKLKYRKAMENLDKKIKRIVRKQSQSTSFEQLISKPFNTSISHEIFYEMENQKYKPIDQSLMLNKKQLPELYKAACGPNSLLKSDFNLAYETILSNPSNNLDLYQKIQKRCEYFEEQLSLNVYEQYEDLLKQNQQALNLEKQGGQALRNLKGVEKSKDVFSKDFKFILKATLTPQDNYYASEIAKIITKYGFSSQKLAMLSLKSLSNEGYRTLTPASLANYLFILAYHNVQIVEMNDNLFKIFEVVSKYAETNQNSKQFLGEMGPINSFLFYLLSSKIEMYELLKDIINNLKDKQNNYTRSEQMSQVASSICKQDRQLFWIMTNILSEKYQLSLQKDDSNKEVKISQVLKNIPQVNSNSHEDFERYLNKKQYLYEKSFFQSSISQRSKNRLVQDQVYTIEDKNFLCLNLPRISKTNEKPNGIGHLILQHFRIIGEPVKIINPWIVNECQKWGQKQQYFKSKLKGIKQPQIKKKRRFDF